MNFKDKDVAFFYRQAGFGYDPKVETKNQGRIRGARALAEAERMARSFGWEYHWTDDWEIGSHVKYYGEQSFPEEPATCECCQLLDAGGVVLESLSCIDDADKNYRRVVEAELALEAISKREERLASEAESAGDVPEFEKELSK